MKTISVLPTLLTLGNTFCGFLAIAKIGDALLLAGSDHQAFESRMMTAACLIFLAMLFDALDGRVARMTRQATDFGAQLDSLTDLITFGVAPAFLVKVLCEYSFLTAGHSYKPKFILLLSVLFVVCAALRLARFTLETGPDEQAHQHFKGLPSPAAAGVAAAAVIFYFKVIVADALPLAGGATGTLDDAARAGTYVSMAYTRVLPFLLPLLGLLMVSRIPYPHVVSRFLRGKQQFFYVVQVVFLGLLIVVFQEWFPVLEAALLAGFLGYALSGCFLWVVRHLSRRRETPRVET